MEPDTNPSDDIKSRGANRKTTRVLFVLIFVATIFALYFYREVRILESDPSETVTKEISTLVLKVGKLIELPSGELPVRATIKDIAPLTGNPFFANARVGDEVLIYTVARKSFLYSPERNVIVDVASITLGR